MFSLLSFGPDGIRPKEKRRRNRVDANERPTNKHSNSRNRWWRTTTTRRMIIWRRYKKSRRLPLVQWHITRKRKKRKLCTIRRRSECGRKPLQGAQQRARGKQQSSGKTTFLIKTVAETINRRKHRPYQKPRSPTRWPWWTRWKDGMKKVGWGRNSRRVCVELR